MDKFKELWGKNKVLIVLGIILVICLIAILCVTVSFFFGGSKSVYGTRLEEIDKYPITDSFKNSFIKNLEEDEKIDKVNFDVKGRVIYLTINFVDDIPLLDAKSKATATLQDFDENILSYYDINYTLYSKETDNSEGFTILGARNVSGTGSLIWNNNTPVESED